MSALPKQSASNAARKADAHLRALVARCEHEDTPVLPQLDRMAADAGVSRMTMWRAVGELRREGVLAAGKGRRILLASFARTRNTTPGRITAANYSRDQSIRIEQRIRQSLASGEFATDERLPAIKELCRRYRTSAWTVRQALSALCVSGELERCGRSYQRPAAEADTSGRAVVLVAFGRAGRINMVSSRTQDQLRYLENECSRLGLRLMTCSHDSLLATQSSREFIGDMRRLDPLGYILWETGIGAANFRPIVELLHGLHAPLAVLTESWGGAPPVKTGPGTLVAWYKMGVSIADGERMGRYLWNLGHRHIAFISTDHRDGDGHSFERWKGLTNVFGAPSAQSSVELYTIDMGPDGAMDLTFAGAVAQAADLLFDPGERALATDRWKLRKASQDFLALANSSQWTIAEKAGLHDLLAEILNRKHITCWVGDNDITALACLTRLNRSAIRVPADLSVAGFDDGLRSLMVGLTSYNFGGADMMRALMAFITRPNQLRLPGPIQVSGKVVPRVTTAPPC